MSEFFAHISFKYGSIPIFMLFTALIAIITIISYKFMPARIGKLAKCSLIIIRILIMIIVLSGIFNLMIVTYEPRDSDARLLLLFDCSKSMSVEDMDGISRYEAVKKAVSKNASFFDKLGKKFSIASGAVYDGYKDIGETKERLQTIEKLLPDGRFTDISNALNTMAVKYNDKKIAGIVIFSDGKNNTGENPEIIAKECGFKTIPIFSVGAGSDEPPVVDISIGRIMHREVVDKGTPIKIKTEIKNLGNKSAQAVTFLKLMNEVIDSKEITLQGNSQEFIEFYVIPGEVGVYQYSVYVPKLDNEIYIENNYKRFLIEVTEEKIRNVLYIEEQPRWEFKFLKRLLEKDKGYEIKTVLQTGAGALYRQGVADKDELSKGFPSTYEELCGYDILVMGSIKEGFLTPDNYRDIVKFIEEGKGSLLMLGPGEDAKYFNSFLGEILPVVLTEARRNPNQEFNFEFTEQGKDIISLLADSKSKSDDKNVWWLKSHASSGCYDNVEKVKPGASILACYKERGEAVPLIINQRIGNGSCMMITFDTTWKWDFQEKTEDKCYELFWHKILSLLIRERNKITLITDKDIYTKDEPVKVELLVLDDFYNPIKNVKGILEIETGDKTITIDLQSLPAEDGKITYYQKASSSGKATIKAKVYIGDDELKASAIYYTYEIDREFIDPNPDFDLLRKISSLSGGAFVMLRDIDKLEKSLMEKCKNISFAKKKSDLWDAPLFLIAILSLLSLEWFIRKWHGML